MKVSKYRRMLLYSIFGFAVSAFSFMLIPLSDFRGSALQKTIAYMIGALFWLGLISGLIITIKLGQIRKNFSEKKYKLPGVMCFFKNKQAICCDVLMGASVILLVIFQKLFGTYHIASIVLLSLTVFLVYIHSIVNGNNFAYATQKGVKK